MNSRTRVRRAMRHETPDRVPVMCQLALGHYFLHSGQRPAEIWFDSDAFVDTLLEFQQRYRFDGILLNLPGRPPDWREYVAKRGPKMGQAPSIRDPEPVPFSETLFWQNGLRTDFVPDDNPHTFQADGGALPRADYQQIDPDDPGILRLPGYVWNIWHAPHLWDIPESADLTDEAAYPAWYTRGLQRARELGESVSVHAEVFSPLTHLMELFGYENALLALLDAPATCHRLLELLTRVVIAQVRCNVRHQPDAVLISSAFAGAGFISRAMYAEFVLPYEHRVAESVRQFQIPVYTHTCGAIGDRLDLMVQTGIDGIDTLDPPPLGTVDLQQAKAEFGDRIFFKGNLDAVHEMLMADQSTFERAVRQRLEIGAPGSGYILSSACSVSPHVSPDRLATMTELAERHGRYEIV
jgi:uroporphyrinogen-III decarboxylase